MAKTFGINMIPATNIDAAYKWMEDAGTCCLAYGDWTKTGYELLTAGYIKERHKDIDDPDFAAIDDELVELMVMLPVLRMVSTTALYWNGDGRISTEPFDGCEYGVDVSDVRPGVEFDSLDKLSEYCAKECAHRVLVVHVAIKAEDGYHQAFDWVVATAQDYNMLEGAICGAANASDGEATDVEYNFLVS